MSFASEFDKYCASLITSKRKEYSTDVCVFSFSVAVINTYKSVTVLNISYNKLANTKASADPSRPPRTVLLSRTERNTFYFKFYTLFSTCVILIDQ